MSKVILFIRLHMKWMGKCKLVQRVKRSKKTERPYVSALLSLRQPFDELLKNCDLYRTPTS